jgi:hypothetical protein
MPAQVTRIQPHLGPAEYKTYQVVAPNATHWRKATCAEIECEYYIRGWMTEVDPATELGRRQMAYITRESGRRFSQERMPTGLVQFTFEAGQRCFQEHRVRLDRPELYIVRRGDFRMKTGPRRQFQGRNAAADWVDDFSAHQDRLATALGRG